MNQSSTLRLRDMPHWSGAQWWTGAWRFAMLIAGLFIFATGLTLGLQCNLGANSWTVFSDGIARHSVLTIGQASQITGLVMIAIGWFVGVRPGLGTVLNMVLVGWFLDLELQHGWIPQAGSYPARLAMMLATVAVLGLATGLYIKAGFGAGPRDSFMLAVTRLTGWPVGLNRWLMESGAVVAGILLGGDFGVGTILMALMIGPAVGFGFRLFGLPTKKQVEKGKERTG
ncbi:MAG TPA: membrane protein [Thermomicrobiaceae bacterium]|nr:membrane protein [Thermomicrobiaceae bacterium]